MTYYTICKANATMSLERQGSAKTPWLVKVKWNSGYALERYFDSYDLADAYARAL